MRALVLGASGMLGHMALRVFADTPGWEAHGTVRDAAALARLPEPLRSRAHTTGDLTAPAALEAAIERAAPTLILNATGVLDRNSISRESAIAVNALLPHRLARLAAKHHARLIHVSTDCVFTGARGSYREEDTPDATDLYGITKRLGEPDPPALTLRTSLIGPERGRGHGLLHWFLSQPGEVPGYARAIFSGLPTIAFVRLLRDHIVPCEDMTGVWHVSANPIAKLDLLRRVAHAWPHPVSIRPVDTPVIDRSLDSSRLRARTGWQPPSWADLINDMAKPA